MVDPGHKLGLKEKTGKQEIIPIKMRNVIYLSILAARGDRPIGREFFLCFEGVFFFLVRN